MNPIRILLLLLWTVAPASDSEAVAIWPDSIPEPWQGLTSGGGVYTDPLGDENPDSTDVVGGLIGATSYTAGFWHQSLANDQISFRMRIDESGLGDNNVWQFFLDTDGDPTAIDWVLEVRQSGPPSDKEVIFTQATTGGPTFKDVALSGTPAWTGTLADWSRWIAVDDGSTFDEPPDAPGSDFFIDVAMPLSLFQSITGIGPGGSIGLGLSTSASHTAINKDVPLGLAPTSLVSLGFGDPIAVPEPGSAVFVGPGLAAFAALRRRPSRDSSS